MPDAERWQRLQFWSKDLKEIARKIGIVLVANSKTRLPSVMRDYAGHSVVTEYFSDEEIEELLSGLRACGFYVEAFFDEDEFIRWILDRGLESTNKPYHLVHSTAQAGVGPGRKALIPSFCELHQIPTTNSDPYVVSLARHKFHVNLILQAAGVRVPRCWLFDRHRGWLLDRKPPMGAKVISKPTYESASIGVDENSVREVDKDFSDSIGAQSQVYMQPITVQEFIPGYEIEIPMIGLESPFALGRVGISVDDEQYLQDRFLTYDRVFHDRYDFFDFDKVEARCKVEMKKCAEMVFRVLGIRNFGRADFRMDEAGNFYVIDVATNPHITHHSSFAFAFQLNGLKYVDMLSTLVGLAAKRHGWI